MKTYTGENIIAVAVRHSNGQKNYFLTLGKFWQQAELEAIAKRILENCRGYALDGEPIEAEVCYSITDAANEPYFYEALSELGRVPLPDYCSGSSTINDKKAEQVHKAVLAGRYTYFLGSKKQRDGSMKHYFSMRRIKEKQVELPSAGDVATRAAPSRPAAKRYVMPETRSLPRTPEQLLEELFVIFPQYRTSYGGPIHDEAPTFHSVLIGFSFFPLASSSEAQLREFGALVSAAVAAGGPLANAFETCLLEHLHQIRAEQALRPYLSKTARERTKAKQTCCRQRRDRVSVGNRTSLARRA